MQFYQIKVNPLTGLKKQIKLVFNPRRSLLDAITPGFWKSSKHPDLPFRTSGYDFSVEYGLRLKPHSTLNWLNPKILIIISLIISLPLFWWLNNSNASVPTPAFSSAKAYPINPTSSLVAISQQSFRTASIPSVDVLTAPLKKVNLPSPTIISKTLPWLHLKVRAGDTLLAIFKKHKLNRAELYQLIKMEQYAKRLRQLYIGQGLHIQSDLDGNIKHLILILKNTKELYIYQDDATFYGTIRRIGMHTKIVTAQGKIDTSLSAATQKTGLSTKLLDKFIKIFHWNIDFKNQIKVGDQFSVVYEQHEFEGTVEEGDILAAEFINQGKTYRALRYINPAGYMDYYMPMGDSLTKVPLLSAPLRKYSRISSRFGNRRHPISKRFAFHDGIDYAANWGTPVFAAGDATVKFMNRNGGYGHTVILQHNQRIQTLYAHLSNYAKELKVGKKVSRGQIIGYVGQSGRVTGLHLHYEIKLDNKCINPLIARNPIIVPIKKTNQAKFIKQTQPLLAKLDAISKPMPTKLAQNFHTPVKASNPVQLTLIGKLLKQPSLLEQHAIAIK
jgi:murein DD-endopeptidase MepM/ murein hydrolase activator NlpD